MTEKRFTLAYSDYDWWAVCDKENPTKRGISDNDVVDLLNQLNDENEQLKQQLFETSKELLWATSDEVDRALHYEDEVEELRKEIFE